MGRHQKRVRLAKRGETASGRPGKNRFSVCRSLLGQALGSHLIGIDDDCVKCVHSVGKQFLSRGRFRHLAKCLAGAAGIHRRIRRPSRAMQPCADTAVSLRRFG